MRRRDWVWLLWWVPAVVMGSELRGVVERAGQPVGEAVVYLDVVAEPAVVGGSGPVVVDFYRGKLAPRVSVAECSGELLVQNSDPTLRVVRVEAFDRERQATLLTRLAMPYAGYERRVRLPACREPLLVRICGENGAEGVRAYVAVLPHRWVGVTGGDGAFRLEAVPRGRWRLCVWHERWGTHVEPVVVNGSRWVTVRWPEAAKP